MYASWFHDICLSSCRTTLEQLAASMALKQLAIKTSQGKTLYVEVTGHFITDSVTRALEPALLV